MGTKLNELSKALQDRILKQMQAEDAEKRGDRGVTAPVAVSAAPAPQQSVWVLEIEPRPAPRMTRSDQWKRRDAVQRYFDYRDAIREVVGQQPVPDGLNLFLRFSMPESWSKKKKAAMDGKLHKQRPDVDNLVKAVMDSLFDEDGGVAMLEVKKVWGRTPVVRIEFY